MAQGYTYEQAEKLTSGYVAVPGTSEHHTGLGIDIGSGKKTYAWLATHCWEFGFILRYPPDKTQATGFNYEPWHFRYVGKTMAKYIMGKGLTLEEFTVEANEAIEEFIGRGGSEIEKYKTELEEGIRLAYKDFLENPMRAERW